MTAIVGNAKRNLDIYTRVLGLRLVKKTVNFDDPGTYLFTLPTKPVIRVPFLLSFPGTTACKAKEELGR